MIQLFSETQKSLISFCFVRLLYHKKEANGKKFERKSKKFIISTKMIGPMVKHKKMFEKYGLKCYDIVVDIKQGEKETYGL